MAASHARQRRSATLNCRVSPEHKRLIQAAAQQVGFSLSDYIVHTLVAAASAVAPRSFDARPQSDLVRPVRHATVVDQRGSEPASQRRRDDWRVW